jgi:hypothetical protein
LLAVTLAVTVFCVCASAQVSSTMMTGVITDASGAAVPNAEVTLTELSTALARKASSDESGLYQFPRLQPGAYELRVAAKGFRDYVQKGLKLNLMDKARVDVRMEVGTVESVVEVQANASQVNFENAEQKAGVSPETMSELPLMVSNGVRSAATFVTLLPGAASPTGDAIDARYNGGTKYAGEALLNGSSLINPSGGQGMYSAAMDFAQSPDMVSELKVLQANYEPQYGSTGGAVIIMETKSGSNQWHGTAFSYTRNTVFNARQFNVPDRPRDNQNDFGGNFSGPLKAPWLTSANNKAYFFFGYEGFRQRGAPTRDVMTIPSMKNRVGDFSDWTDGEGNLIPVYDPATTVWVDGVAQRQQFMGCNGNQPNVICPSRIQNSLAQQWFKYLPTPTFGGVRNNFVPTGAGSIWTGNANLFNGRVDQYVGNNDHFTVTIYRRDQPTYTESRLPDEISTDNDVYKYTWSNRVIWDHIFSPTLISTINIGYNHDYYQAGAHNAYFADALPKIKGAPSNDYPPAIELAGFTGLGNATGFPENNKWPAPAWAGSALTTWIKGKHTLKFGFEYRNQRNSSQTSNTEAGVFSFGPDTTGLLNVNSGSPIASFLLETVGSGRLSYYPYGMWSARFGSYIAHVGDTWKVTRNLTLNLGIRWDMHTPSVEQHDVFSYFDAAGPNPGAGNRPGRLTFAGDRWGAVSSGKRYPEDLFKKAFAPRVGIAYALDSNTVVRTGYGIFYDAGYYPGWTSGIANDGFNANAISFGSTMGGLEPAFILSEGLPTNWTKPPFLDPTYLNGQGGPIYRPKDANRLPYTQQWNFSLERQITKDTIATASYVGTKGTRLTSRIAPLNVIDPKYLSLGDQLYDQFTPDTASLHGVSLPYNGWVEQMAACAPDVAQALKPFPQYCGSLQGNNENAGNSTYHSLQLKLERRFSKGLWFLASYTLSKTLTDVESNQPDEALWNGQGGSISPFERQRNKSLSAGDIPHALTASWMYDLPFGKGQKWANNSRVLDAVIGGWRLTSIMRFNSGTPFAIRSYNCNIPGAFSMGCLPGVLAGKDPWAQDKSNFNPDMPLLNASSFEDPSSFNYYGGNGSRISNLRGFGYKNVDLTITKSFKITERVGFQVRGDIFNVMNMHVLRGFDTDVASPTFGMWNGSVTNPRYVQLGGRVSF